jgi:hypothetical protein
VPRSPRTRPAPRPTAPPATRTPLAERVRPWQGAAGLALLHLLVVLPLVGTTPFEGGDNATYLALARSLLEDGSYRDLWDPAAAAHTQYPPGWPLVLAAAMAVGIQPWTGFKVLVALFSAAAVALSYLWARRVSSPGVALGVGLLLAIGFGVADLARTELADVPFWTFSMLALWGFSRLPPSPPRAAPPIPAPAALPALALAAAGVLLAYGTRSAGLPLLAAAAAWLVWTRRWRALAFVAAVVSPFTLAWALRGRAVGAGGYGQYLWLVDPYRPDRGTVGPGELVERLGRNAAAYASEHLPFLLAGEGASGLGWPLGVAVLVLAAAGWALRARRGGGLAEWWLPLYLGLVLLWPYEWAGARFLLPALPVLLLSAAEALAAAAERTPRPAAVRRAAAVAALAVPAVLGLPRLGGEAARMARCRAEAGPLEPYACMRPEAADFLGMARSLRGELPPGSVVIARKPTLFWAESGYPSRVYPFSADPDTLLRAAREAGARYLVLDVYDNLSSIHLVPAIVQRPQAFCVLRTHGPERSTLLGILPGAGEMENLRERPGDETVEMAFDWCPPGYWAEGAGPRGRGER